MIVNAAYESGAIWALSKDTGEVRWKFEDERLKLAGGTPTLTLNTQPPQLLLACPNAVLSLSADDGHLVWWASVPIDFAACPASS